MSNELQNKVKQSSGGIGVEQYNKALVKAAIEATKITFIKSPSTTPLEVVVVDSPYAVPGAVMLIPNGTEVIDPSTPYRDRIQQLEHELAKARRAEKHILNNLCIGE
jgi:hypothetical protein